MASKRRDKQFKGKKITLRPIGSVMSTVEDIVGASKWSQLVCLAAIYFIYFHCLIFHSQYQNLKINFFKRKNIIKFYKKKYNAK